MTVVITGRWTGVQKNENSCHHLFSDPGLTLKANGWVPFPTWPRQDLDTAAQVFSLHKESRCHYPYVQYPMSNVQCTKSNVQCPLSNIQCPIFDIPNRACLLLVEARAAKLMNRARSCTYRQTIGGQQDKIFQGENYFGFGLSSVL